MIDAKILKIDYKNCNMRKFMKCSFCGLCNQILFNKPVSYHVLFKNHFAKSYKTQNKNIIILYNL